ncbi:RHS repeat-associated core domain-containing protein, partial [Leptospira santarosai]|nr:RHS repeat-associated core domain-containing protein [Leptospira santarosai]
QYEVPKNGGGKQTKSVQQQTMDRSHPNEKHWEAGKVKTDGPGGEVRYNNYGRPKLDSDKSKVNYE